MRWGGRTVSEEKVSRPECLLEFAPEYGAGKGNGMTTLLGNPRSWLLPVLVGGIVMLTGLSLGADDKPSHAAVKPVPREGGWLKRHESFVDRAKKGGVDVVFLGDSITQGWEGGGKDIWKERFDPLKAANFGISGDRTEHVLWRITTGKELEGIDPKAFVIMIGTNNLGNKQTPEMAADGVTAIVKELRKQKPSARILLLAVFPRGAKSTDGYREKVKDVNQRIAKLADGKAVQFLDIGGKFLDQAGDLPKEIMPDALHLSAKGYKIWADSIQSQLNDLLKN